MRDHRPSAFGNWLYPGKNKLIYFKNCSPFLNRSHWKRLWFWEGLGSLFEHELLWQSLSSCIKSSSFTLQDFRKMAMLVLSDSSQKNGRVSGLRWQRCITRGYPSPHRHIKWMGEIGNFSKKVAARYRWTLEKFRIQPSLQVNNKTSWEQKTTRT